MPRLTARLGAVATAAGILLISGAATAGAATTEPTGTRTAAPATGSLDRQSLPDRQTPPARQALPDRQTFWNYRGVQGGNLCLLSRCTVGDDSGAGQGPSNTQGFNLCLLSVCGVRP